MRVLITGITGFAGSHLAEYALANGAEVYGSIRARSRRENIARIQDRLVLIDCDLRDVRSAWTLVDASRPDRIFHLAGQSYVATSWRAPAETLHTNVICQVNLLEAVRVLKLDPLIQITGSSEEYGLVFETECPIRETNPLRPLSPYGVSKIAQDFLGYQYFKSYALRTVRTRAFNHTGPRRGRVFVTSSLARQIAEIEKGLRPPVLAVGNLEARRDFSDVRDIVHGYWLALEKGTPGDVYNLASGQAHSIADVIKMLLTLSPVGPDVRVVPDEERKRPSEVPLLLGHSGKFHAETGWVPHIPLERTLADLLDYWRERVASGD